MLCMGRYVCAPGGGACVCACAGAYAWGAPRCMVLLALESTGMSMIVMSEGSLSLATEGATWCDAPVRAWPMSMDEPMRTLPPSVSVDAVEELPAGGKRQYRRSSSVNRALKALQAPCFPPS